jgi:aminoglycoside 3-N-acetyltransferase
MTFVSKAAALLAELGTGPVFAHSDPFRTARVVKPSRNRREFLDAHVTVLKEVAGDRGLWIPAFNYDFPRTHFFDVANDEAQVGPIPEHFRTTAAEWRTRVPIFSVTGTGPMPSIPWGQDTDAFGEESIFARLVESDGVILYYGDTFCYNTIVHYAERRSGGPAYRYDKMFGGQVFTNADNLSALGSLRYHVRPLGTDLDYDWPGLLDSAIEAGACRRVDGSPEVLASSARTLCDFWIEALRRDRLALLDQKTRAWVEPKLEKLGRPFMIADFEAL